MPIHINNKTKQSMGAVMTKQSSIAKRYMRYLFDRSSQKCWSNVLDYLENRPGCVLIDMGCGDGNMTMQMAKLANASVASGIECDEQRINVASKKGIKIYKADMNKEFPIPNDSVDVVVASQVIEHIIDVDNFVKETFRILKRNGYAIIATENLSSWHNIFALLMGKQPYSGPYASTELNLGRRPLTDMKEVFSEGGTHDKAYVKHNTVMAYVTLKDVLEAYGFTVSGSKGFGYHPWPGKLSDALSRADIKHSHFILYKITKP